MQQKRFLKTLWNSIVHVESELDESEGEETGRKSSSVDASVFAGSPRGFAKITFIFPTHNYNFLKELHWINSIFLHFV